MINGDMVVAQTLQGAIPPTWRVLHAKASFFYQQIGLAIFVLVIGAGGFLGLVNSPDTAYGYGIGGLQPPNVINTWRTIDFIVLALFAFGGVYWLVKNIVEMTHAKQQVLVLMPEGFVVNSDKRAAYAYATMRTLNATVYRGSLNVTAQPVDGSKAIKVAIDGRFGNMRQLAQTLMTARNQFAAAQVAAQYPQSPASYSNPQA